MLVYTVQVRTGDVSGAGTDANVFIALSGDKVFPSFSPPSLGYVINSHLTCNIQGTTGRRKLRSAKNNFERAKVDTFELKSRDLGMFLFRFCFHFPFPDSQYRRRS